MATVILVRHGRTTANTSGVLAGRTPGVRLDDAGVAQAARTAERLVGRPARRRRDQPAGAVPRRPPGRSSRQQQGTPATATERGITECDYGAWQGTALKDLAKEPLWKTVQTQPSAAAFPERRVDVGDAGARGRPPYAVSTRSSRPSTAPARCGWRSATATSSSRCSPTRSGMHLDLFQRLHVDPASVSIVRYTGDPALRARHQHPRRRPVLAQAAAAKKATRRRQRRRGRRRRGRRRARGDSLGAVPRVVACPLDPRLRPAGALRHRHRRRARAAHLLPAGAQRRPASSASRSRSSRWPRSAERIDQLLDEVMASDADAVA